MYGTRAACAHEIVHVQSTSLAQRLYGVGVQYIFFDWYGRTSYAYEYDICTFHRKCGQNHVLTHEPGVAATDPPQLSVPDR